ncbi:MAG: electron transfer flavoprotein subunit alpha/FixB family protein, partial [Rubritepida sp.]|nr:electron transfer flavoprotein subunit alpha/FixB family protein [Rubritepida sp.]
MTVHIIADHDGDTITEPTRSTVAALGSLGAIHLLLMGEGAQAASASAAAIPGVEAVLVAAGEPNPAVEA